MVNEQKVFYANMCFICHLTAKEVKLKYCSACNLVSYCSESHQRKDWKTHKEFCRVIQDVERTLSSLVNLEFQNWYRYRINLMLLCEVTLGRKLKQHEMDMVLFPNNCQICHKRTDLKACRNCLCISYCSDNHENADIACHTSICHLFSLCLKIDSYQEKSSFSPRYNIRQGDIELLDDISFFIASNIVFLKRNRTYEDIEEALLSEFLTCPLSLLYALSRLNYCLEEYSVIHVVGSGALETMLLKSWEVILQIHSNVTKLVVHFIGPDTEIPDESHTSCEGGRLKFKFSDQFYHEFVNDESYEKPNLICAFNCGFHEYVGTQIDTWKNSLPLLIENRNLPFMFTSFTQDEAEQDLKQLLQIEPNLNIKLKCQNPFSSLRPYRDPENLGVYFNNKYLSIVSNDFT